MFGNYDFIDTDSIYANEYDQYWEDLYGYDEDYDDYDEEDEETDEEWLARFEAWEEERKFRNDKR